MADGNLRVAREADVLRLAWMAEVAGLNQLFNDVALMTLAPGGVSLLELLWPYHGKAEPSGRPYHGVRALLEVSGVEAPAVVYLDVLASCWDELLGPDEYVAVLEKRHAEALEVVAGDE